MRGGFFGGRSEKNLGLLGLSALFLKSNEAAVRSVLLPELYMEEGVL